MDIDMDIKELEAFVYVVENCSFSRAAELLHLTQPTISSHISALERKLGIKLVVRTTKETYPSDAGKLLYKYAKEISAEDEVKIMKRIKCRGATMEACATKSGTLVGPLIDKLFSQRFDALVNSLEIGKPPRGPGGPSGGHGGGGGRRPRHLH